MFAAAGRRGFSAIPRWRHSVRHRDRCEDLILITLHNLASFCQIQLRAKNYLTRKSQICGAIAPAPERHSDR